MRRYQTTARIFGDDPEIYQDVNFKFDLVYSCSRIVITHVTLIMDKWHIKPQDFKEDICQAVCEYMGFDLVFFNAEVDLI